MALTEITLNGEMNKVDEAIKIIKAFAPYENGYDDNGYYVAYSGGKDSDAIRILCELAGVKHELWHNHTTVDAPETVRYVRSIPNINISYPKKSMWQLIVDKGVPPTRIMRYCCSELKERGGQGRLVMTGVRKFESASRNKNGGLVKLLGKPKTTAKLVEEEGANATITEKGGIILNDDNDPNRRVVEQCFRTRKTLVNPIIDWMDDDVWEFLKHYSCKSNPLYQCGFNRIGCIGCPMAGKHRTTQFEIYPKYKLNYIKAFDRMLSTYKEKATTWETGQDVFNWWMNN